MKNLKTYLFLLAAIGWATACKKPTPPTPSPYTLAGTNTSLDFKTATMAEVQTALSGKWYLLSGGGGFTGKEYVEYSGIYYIFGKDTLTINDNGKVDKRPIEWTRAQSIMDTAYGVIQKNGVGVASPIFRYLRNDTLETHSNAYDGFGHTYVKIK